MSEITIRNLELSVLHRLRQIAWRNGVSLEDSLRAALIDAARLSVAEPPDKAVSDSKMLRPDLVRSDSLENAV
jgi:plasmid stability protein